MKMPIDLYFVYFSLLTLLYLYQTKQERTKSGIYEALQLFCEKYKDLPSLLVAKDIRSLR